MALASLLLVAFLSAPAGAQGRSEVRFAPGADHATMEGKVTGHEYADYALAARAGQTMTVTLRVTGTDGDGTAYFNILPPGSDNVRSTTAR